MCEEGPLCGGPNKGARSLFRGGRTHGTVFFSVIIQTHSPQIMDTFYSLDSREKKGWKGDTELKEYGI